MNSTVRILSILLVVQLGLFGLLRSTSNSLTTFKSDTSLLNLDFSTVDTLVVSDSDASLELVKGENDQWKLPTLYDFPASRTKISSLFEKIGGLTAGWPVGTSEIAANEFKVTDESFERKLEFKKGADPLRKLYLGSSPGFKKVYARVDGSSETHSVPLNTYEASTTPSDWIDTKYANVDLLDVNSITLGELTLVKKDEVLTLAEIPEGKEINEVELNSLRNNLTQWKILDVLGTEDKPEYKMATPTITIQFASEKEEKQEYQLSLMDEGEGEEKKQTGILKIARAPYFLTIPEGSIVKLRDFDSATLLKDKKADDSATAESAISDKDSAPDSSELMSKVEP